MCVYLAGLQRLPSFSVSGCDVRVIKGTSKRVRFDLYKARYDHNSATPSACAPSAAACGVRGGPNQDARRTDKTTGGSDLTYFEVSLITLTSLAIILGPGRRHRPVTPPASSHHPDI